MTDFIPKRAIDAHKGQCGRVGIIAGSSAMMGAAVLCAKACLRGGAGLVYLMTIDTAAPFINIVHPEIIVLPLPQENGFISSSSLKIIRQYITQFSLDTLAIGPGLGQHTSISKLIHHLTRSLSNIPIVLDADGINMAKQTDLNQLQNFQCVLTPHPKEFSRLFGIQPQDDQDARIQITLQTAKQHCQIILLKGYQSIISNGSQYAINTTGDSALATAGSGDVLTGLISALLAQKVPIYEASIAGAHLHGLAGDIAKKKRGIHSVIASDIIDHISDAFLQI